MISGHGERQRKEPTELMILLHTKYSREIIKLCLKNFKKTKKNNKNKEYCEKLEQNIYYRDALPIYDNILISAGKYQEFNCCLAKLPCGFTLSKTLGKPT